MDEIEAEKSKGKAFKAILIISVLSFITGACAGVVGWQQFNPRAEGSGKAATHKEESSKDAYNKTSDEIRRDEEEVAEGGLSEFSVGRIVVPVGGSGKEENGPLRLLIDPVIVFDPTSVIIEGEALTEVKAKKIFKDSESRIRDVFIEYLSLTSGDQIRGSYGMSKLRSELLRRAKMVLGDDLPQAVLIRDYMVQ
jgi:flagellar basal body-associated protein FliL